MYDYVFMATLIPNHNMNNVQRKETANENIILLLFCLKINILKRYAIKKLRMNLVIACETITTIV